MKKKNKRQVFIKHAEMLGFDLSSRERISLSPHPWPAPLSLSGFQKRKNKFKNFHKQSTAKLFPPELFSPKTKGRQSRKSLPHSN